MTNYKKPSIVRKLILPTALLFLCAVTVASGGERQVLVKGGKMATRMQNGKMVLTGVQGGVGGGQIQMAGRVAGGADNANTATVKFEDLSLADAAEMIGHSQAAEVLGTVLVSGFAKGNWHGKGLKQISQSANGTISLETGNGVISNPAALAAIEKATGIADLPDLQYTEIKLKAHAENGQIWIDSVTAVGPAFRIAAKGTYLAGTDTLDMRVAAAVSPELAATSSYMKLNTVMGFLRGDDKPEAGEFVKIPQLIVSGKLKKPEVRVNRDKEVAAAATISEGKPVVQDSVKRASKFFLSQAD